MRLSSSVLSRLLGPTGICKQRAKRRANDFFSLSTFSTSKDRECEICNSCVPVSSRGIEKGRRKVSLFLRSKDCLWRGSSFFFFVLIWILQFSATIKKARWWVVRGVGGGRSIRRLLEGEWK